VHTRVLFVQSNGLLVRQVDLVQSHVLSKAIVKEYKSSTANKTTSRYAYSMTMYSMADRAHLQVRKYVPNIL
jgi:hypothetical protein